VRLSTERLRTAATTDGGGLLIQILVLQNAVPLDVSVASQFFGVDLPLAGLPCKVSVCGGTAGVVSTRAGFGLHVDAGVEALTDADLVMVAGTQPADPDVEPAVLDSLRTVHARGVPMVAIGTAAFVLARAGLLDGRRATTHWCHAGELARRYPAVILDREATSVEDGGIYTSTGVRAAAQLCLQIIAESWGAATMIASAQRLAVADDRAAADPGPVHRPPTVGGARPLTEFRAWMASNLDQCASIDDLARRAFMSRRQFTRKFRQEVGASPWQWLIGQRLVQARHLLEETDEQIEAISRRCGFPTALAFRTTFKQSVCRSPSEYRRSCQARNHAGV
jgi:transcriptional regulator GlxA family with amidase domain